jgi:hypothetical protein
MGRSRWLRRLVGRGMRGVAGEETAAGNQGNDEVNGKREVTSVRCPGQTAILHPASKKYIHLAKPRSLFSSLRCLHEVYHLRYNHRSRKAECTITEKVGQRSKRRTLSLKREPELLVYPSCVSSRPSRPDN